MGEHECGHAEVLDSKVLHLILFCASPEVTILSLGLFI